MSQVTSPESRIHDGRRLHSGIDASTLHRPADSLRSRGGYVVSLMPGDSGLRHAGLEVVQLAASETLELETGQREYAIVVLTGSIEVVVDGESFSPAARSSVFEQRADVVYAPRESRLVILARSDCEVALPSCNARQRLKAFHLAAPDIPTATRGAGAASRQIDDILGPGVGHADRMVLVEGFAPGGSWSSYPPHKHDDPSVDGEAVLEEIYWFRLRGDDAWAVHRTYDLDEGWDVTATIRDGDAFLVPRGYHGPTITPPEYQLYFLNVLAGEGNTRSLAFSDDPAHAWIRQESWNDEAVDQRLPLTREPQ